MVILSNGSTRSPITLNNLRSDFRLLTVQLILTVLNFTLLTTGLLA